VTKVEERQQKYVIPHEYFLLFIAVAPVYEANVCQVITQWLTRTVHLIWSHVYRVMEWIKRCAKEIKSGSYTLYLLGRYETFKAMETSSKNIPITVINETVLFGKNLWMQNKRCPCSLN